LIKEFIYVSKDQRFAVIYVHFSIPVAGRREHFIASPIPADKRTGWITNENDFFRSCEDENVYIVGEKTSM
jgi:hypothetical protein